MQTIRTFIAVALIAAITIFAIQNIAVVEVQFLSFQFEMRRWILIAICIIIGFILGWTAKASRT